MKKDVSHFAEGRRLLLMGLIVSLTSQLYLQPLDSGFRISASVIVYGIMLLWLAEDRRIPISGLATAAVVFVFRTLWALAAGRDATDALLSALPGALFYLCYDIIFCVFLPRRRESSIVRTAPVVLLADLLSNGAELWFGVLLGQSRPTPNLLFWLVLTALLRTGCICGTLLGMTYYKKLILLEQHAQRYHRLFLMAAQLRDELYFLTKDIEIIESVMSKAYRLHETLDARTDIPKETQRLALDIAIDIHEIKKDNLRIIRGIESEANAVSDEEEMTFSQLMQILEETTRRMLGEKNSDIRLQCHIEDDFTTGTHYRLLTVIKNLVTNAIEAISADSGHGTVTVTERKEGGSFVFLVEDDGPGIPEKSRPFLFQMGYSTKFDPVTGDINRGVGLVAVKSIVEEEYGGTVTLESAEKRGCLFRVEIPCDALEGASD